MVEDAKVAIIGGGIAGCGLAYHLTKLGWDDVVLLEQAELTAGSTWHAAGLCTQFNSSYNVMGLLRDSVELYQRLEAETGQAVDYHACGSVRLAATEDRLDEFRQRAAMAEVVGVPFEVVGPERLGELHPFVDTSGIVAAAYLPTDGHVDPTGLANAFVRGAPSVRIRRRTAVTGIRRERDRWLLETTAGEVRAEIVVNAAGQWAREVGRLAGADLPLVALQHHYVVTTPLRLPRPRRLQHLRDRVRRRRGSLRRGMDRRPPAERQHVGARRPPLRRLRGHDAVSRPARLPDLRARVRDPLPGRGASGGAA